MKYVATISFTAQVSPDDWGLITRHMEVTPETTAAEIIQWMKKFDRGSPREFVVREVDEKP